MAADAPAFVGEEGLRYQAEQARFAPGEALALSPDYRLCHLPLVAPGHPDAIARDETRGYRDGRHDEVLSLVAPLDADAIEASPGWRAMSAELAASAVGAKIAWDILPRRRDKLHATLCSSLAGADRAGDWRAALRRVGPFAVRVGGAFAGRKNAGRIYLKIFPEARGGRNVLDEVQAALGRAASRFYVAGVWNLVDNLDAGETAELGRWLERWRDVTLVELGLDALWLLASRDDLVLDSRVAEVVTLG